MALWSKSGTRPCFHPKSSVFVSLEWVRSKSYDSQNCPFQDQGFKLNAFLLTLFLRRPQAPASGNRVKHKGPRVSRAFINDDARTTKGTSTSSWVVLSR